MGTVLDSRPPEATDESRHERGTPEESAHPVGVDGAGPDGTGSDGTAGADGGADEHPRLGEAAPPTKKAKKAEKAKGSGSAKGKDKDWKKKKKKKKKKDGATAASEKATAAEQADASRPAFRPTESRATATPMEAGPEKAASNKTKPDKTKPERSEPKKTKSKNAKPKKAKPKNAKPGKTEPEKAKSKKDKSGKAGGHAGSLAPADDPRAVVRHLIKAGKVKKKCCHSKPRCRKCPVLALKQARAEAA
ncbi:hypothetical protein [Saccharomonospora saliphila]|uniref:hypothetical protein n=1 Tax=Saccharomonospora saliphila TaxID=369829 RepID=UPI0003726613|nr:hypothetical protein [Saccharomonospora saliphila]